MKFNKLPIYAQSGGYKYHSVKYHLQWTYIVKYNMFENFIMKFRDSFLPRLLGALTDYTGGETDILFPFNLTF